MEQQEEHYCKFCKEEVDNEHFLNDDGDVCEEELDSLELISFSGIDFYVNQGYTRLDKAKLVIVDNWQPERIENAKIDYESDFQQYVKDYLREQSEDYREKF